LGTQDLGLYVRTYVRSAVQTDGRRSANIYAHPKYCGGLKNNNWQTH